MNVKSSTTLFSYRTVAAIAILLLMLVALPVSPAYAAACTFTSTGTGNWNGAIWSAVGSGCGAYPGASFSGDTVVIAAGHTVTLNLSPANSIASLTFSAGANENSLIFGGTNSLTVTGTVTINGTTATSSSHVTTLNIGAGTLSANSIAIVPNASNGGTTNRRTEITISTGTINSTGDITIANTSSGTGSGIIFSGAGTINVGGSFLSATNVAFTASTGTVNYNGTSAQTIESVLSYNNLTISNSGTKTLEANTTIGGNLSVNGGTLDLSIFTANRSAAGGTFILANGATLLVGGTSNFPTNYNTNTVGSTSTVNYSMAGAQTVSVQTYGNLIFSGSGAKSMASATSTAGTLSIAPTGTATASIAAGQTLSVNSLTLGGLGRIDGTWGSTSSTATSKNDTYFAVTTGRLNVATDTRSTSSINTLPTATGINYGQALSASTLTGGSGSVTGSFAFTTPSTFPNAGTFSASVTFTPSDLTSYKTTTGNVNVAVAKVALSVTATNDSQAYNGVAYSGGNGVTYSGFVNGDTSTSLGGTLAFSGTSQGAINVGSYVITPGGLTSSNYNITFNNGSLAISAKPITVTANSGQTKVFGAADPTFTFGVSPSLVSGDSLTGALSRAAGENVGTYAITQGNLSAGSNYTITFVAANFSITAKPITVTPNNGQSRVYGAVDPTYSYTSTALESGDSFTGALGRVLGSNVGTYAFTLHTLSAGSNYTLSLAPGHTFAITVKPITVTAESGQTKVFGQTDPTFTFDVTPALVSGDSFSGALSRVSGEDVGTYAITQGTLSAGSNYTLTFVADDFSISAKPITVTPNDNQSKVYGATDPTFTYTSTPLESGDSFTGALSRAMGSNVGNYAFTLGTLSASSNYTLSLAPGHTFAITAKPITVTADSGQTKVFGAADPIFTYDVSTSLVGGDSFTGALDRSGSEDVGTYTILQGTLSAGSNYTITFVSANFSITAKPITVTPNNGQSKVYGAIEPTFTYTSTPLESGDTFTGALGRAGGSNVGMYAFTFGTLSAGSNYTLSLAPGHTFAITAKPITVTADSGQTKVFGAADPTFTFDVAPALVGTDSFSGALSRALGEDVGTYAITQGTLSVGSNYTISFVAANFSVTAKPITVTPDDNQSKVYGAVDPTFTYTSTPLESGDSFIGGLGRAAGNNVGTYAFTPGTLSAGSNYTLSLAPGHTFAITAKPITVTADNGQTKVFGAADPALTYEVSPALVSGDSFNGALSRVTGQNVGAYAITQGTLSAGSNYTITFVSDDFNITAKPITVTPNNGQSKIYGAGDPTLTYTFTPLQSGDSFTGALGRFAGDNVGTYGFTLGTLDAGSNYTLSLAPGHTFAITAKSIIVTADSGQTKVFGATDPAFTYTSTPLESGDSFSGALGRIAGEDIGTYALTQGTLSAGSNYTISFVSDDFSITAKPITVTADSGQTKVFGDVDPAFTYVSSDLGASFTGALSRAAGENVGTYALMQGNLSAGSNYTITFVSANFSITAKPITVTADSGQTKVFGNADPIFTYVSSDLGASFTGALGRAAGEDVGTYALTQGTLSASNYSITFVPANFSITARPITVTADDKSKFVGDPDPTFTFSVSGFVGLDTFVTDPTCSVSGAHSAEGTYPIVCSGAAVGSNYMLNPYVNGTLTVGPVTTEADIDIRIHGQLQASYVLSQGQSTRISYVGVNNGPVEVSNTGILPITASERLIYKVNGKNTSFSEMMGLPDAQLDNTYWLPWYNNVDLDTQLRFGNVSSSNATVHVFIGGVEMTGSPFTLAPGESTRKSFAGINNGPVKIESDQDIVAAERLIYKVNKVNTSFTEMMALPNTELDTTYWLPWYNNVDLDTQLRFANISASTATVHVKINGVEMTGSPFTMAPGESTRKSFAGINNGPVKIESNQLIVAAERVIYKVNKVNTSFTEMMALPDSQLDTTYWLPWYNNVDLDTQLRFANTTNATATVHVYVGGVEMTGSPFTLTAGASTRLSFASVNNGPVQIVSNVPIVAAERVIYKVSGVNTSFTEMMALPNTELDTTYWLPWYNNVDLDTQLRFGVP